MPCQNLSQLNKILLGGLIADGATSFSSATSQNYLDGTGDSSELAQKARLIIIKSDPVSDIAPEVVGWESAPGSFANWDVEKLKAEIYADGWDVTDGQILVFELPTHKARYWGVRSDGTDSTGSFLWYIERYAPKTQSENPPNTMSVDGVMWQEIPV